MLRAQLRDESCRLALAEVEVLFSPRAEYLCGSTNLLPRALLPSAPPPTRHGWDFLAITLVPKAASTSLIAATRTLVPEFRNNRNLTMLDRSSIIPCGQISIPRVRVRNTLSASTVRNPFSRMQAGVREILHSHCDEWLKKSPSLPRLQRDGLPFAEGLHQLASKKDGCYLMPFSKSSAGPGMRWDHSKEVFIKLTELLLADVVSGIREWRVTDE
ncbi:MAG: hypothetical protein SGPRY_005411 [Prymnesium sp.]